MKRVNIIPIIKTKTGWISINTVINDIGPIVNANVNIKKATPAIILVSIRCFIPFFALFLI